MTIKFYTRTKSKTATVYIKVSIGRGKEYRKKTKYVSDSERWRNGYPSDSRLKVQLKELETKLEKAYNQTETISADWLDNLLNRKEAKTVVDHVEQILSDSFKRKNHKGGYGLSVGRIKVYRTFITILNKFHPDLKLEQVDMKLAEDFRDWLFDKGYALNTVGKYCEILKTVVRDYGIHRLDKFKKIQEKKKPLVLTDDEIARIEDLEGLGQRLDNARRWFMLGIRTGQRGEDLLAITQDDFKTVNGIEMIEVLQDKTNKTVLIPVKMEFELPYKISLQKFDTALKELAEKAGINEMVQGLKKQANGKASKSGVFPKHELLSSHDLRRTFATKHYGKIPTPLIMSITGHSSEATFLRYVGKTNVDSALEFAKYL